jgi:hypothetical protein
VKGTVQIFLFSFSCSSSSSRSDERASLEVMEGSRTRMVQGRRWEDREEAPWGKGGEEAPGEGVDVW